MGYEKIVVMEIACTCSKFTRNKNGKSISDYTFAVDVSKMFNAYIDNDTNLRDQNTECKTFKSIVDTLNDETKDFFRMNKGITIVCDKVELVSENMVRIILSDDELHGIVDGGHTYRAIHDYGRNVKPNTQFVRVIVHEDVNTEEERANIALGLNSSTPVNATTFYNYLGYFDQIKEILDNCKIIPRISYRMNDIGIGVAEVISIMQLLNCKTYVPYYVPNAYDPHRHRFASGNLWQPKQSMNTFGNAYIAKEKSIREKGVVKYTEYEKMYPLLIDMIRLYDAIEESVCNNIALVKYNEEKRYYEPKECIKKFVDLDCNETLFLKRRVRWSIGREFVKYILQMFRQFIKVNDYNEYEWAKNPFDYVDIIVDTVLPELIKVFKKEFKKRKECTNNFSEMRNAILSDCTLAASMWELTLIRCKTYIH